MRYFLFLCWGFIFSCGVDHSSDASSTAPADTDSLRDSVKASVPEIQKSDSEEIRELVKEYELNVADTFSIGDFNRDGKQDKAVIMPLNFFYKNHKMDSQYVMIHFADGVPDIKHYNGFRGLVVNVGDLDGNKTDEILYYPDWYQSNLAGIFIYGIKDNQWKLFGSASVRRDEVSQQKDPLEYLRTRVKKINNSKFRISDYIWSEERSDMVDSVKIVTIKD